MNQREKILAGLVGGVVVLAGGFVAMQRINEAYAFRQNAMLDAQRVVDQKELAVMSGTLAREKILGYEERSLPADLGDARSQYQEWLINTTYEFFGDSKMTVDLKKGPSGRGVVYDPLQFTISGSGDLDQLTRFLHRFYDVNYLHRVNVLRIDPIPSSKYLRITCEVEALIVNTTTKKELGDKQGERIAPESLDDYLADILERNVFGKPNEPPQIASVRSQSAYRDDSFSQTISAREFDQLDAVYFELESGPEGMRIGRPEQSGDSWSTKLDWRPRENGAYDVTVVAYDDGLPSKWDRVSFQIQVEDPPRRDPPPTPFVQPGPPAFNYAKYTFLTSVQSINGEPIIWLYSRPTGKKIVAGEGEEVEVGDYKALVRRIDVNANEIELEVEDEIQVLSLGQNLLDARPRSSGRLGQFDSGRGAPFD